VITYTYRPFYLSRKEVEISQRLICKYS